MRLSGMYPAVLIALSCVWTTLAPAVATPARAMPAGSECLVDPIREKNGKVVGMKFDVDFRVGNYQQISPYFQECDFNWTESMKRIARSPYLRVEVRNEPWWWYDYKIIVRGIDSRFSRIENILRGVNDIDFSFTDKASDTYNKSWNGGSTGFDISYNSSAPDIVRIRIQDSGGWLNMGSLAAQQHQVR